MITDLIQELISNLQAAPKKKNKKNPLDQPKWAVHNIHKHFKLIGETKKKGRKNSSRYLFVLRSVEKDRMFKDICNCDHIENKEKEKDKRGGGG